MIIPNISRLDFRGWAYGLLHACIGGGASAVTAGFAVSVIKPMDFPLASMASLKLMFWVFAVSAIKDGFLYLKQSPLPPIVEDKS